MPCWYFDKSDLKKTPSILDGLTPETEARYRREGPRYIFDMGTRLGLHHDTIATAIVFFHRFYVFHSFKKFPRYITATCCLFLAGKVEETPKKCKDLVKTARSLLNDAQFSQFGDDPKEEVMTFERMLLQTIKFDLMVEHPYKYMLRYAKALKGDREKIEKLVQMAFTFINDSLCTSLSLQWEPQIIAVAVMYLAGRLCKFEPQDWAYNRGRWWDQFIDDISTDLLEDICHQILDLYSSQKSAPKSSKSKRERPKTPGDADKSMEPQAKTSRHESKTKAKTSSSESSSKPVHRKSSTNTEVVAMEMEDPEPDNAIIEQNKPIPTTTPIKSEKNKASGTYYDNVNQYQSFMGGGQDTSLTIPEPAKQFAAAYSQPYSSFSQPPTPPPTAPVPTHYGSAPGSSKYPHQFAQQNIPPPTFPPRFTQQPANFSTGYPTAPPPGGSTGLATVRITGRHDQQNPNQW